MYFLDSRLSRADYYSPPFSFSASYLWLADTVLENQSVPVSIIMTESKDERESHLKDIRRSLYEVEGAERLHLWMEYTRYQDKDPDHHVS